MGRLPEEKLTGQGEEQRKEGDGLEEEQDVSFDTLGLDEQLSRALRKKGITVATPIQREATPLILEGKDVVARAKTGSGKTLAYLLPMFHSLLKLCFEKHATKASPNVFILVPARELCQQVYQEASSLLEFCTEKLKLVQLTASMPPREMRISLAGPPNIVVTTPACISTCISKGILKASSIKDSLSMLILDEADLLLSYGYEKDLKALTPHIPRSCQCILMSATSSTDVETLKKLLLHNPVTLTLSEVGSSKDEIIPSSVQQFWEFNAGLLDYLIATDDSHSKEKEQINKETKSKSRNSRRRLKQNLDSEFGVVRGIDFKNVYTVVNCDMPQTAAGYVHRVGRTGRAHNTGTSVSLISPEEEEILEEIKSLLEADKKDLSEIITPFPLLNKNAVESLRYRAQDVARSVTSRDVQDARRQDLKNEILNSQKLKAHFVENPRDLDLLKHDKLLSSKVIPAHLKEIPEYLVDPTTKEASQIVKLTRAAMGIDNGPKKKHRPGFRKGSVKTSNPLRTFSAERGKSRRGRKRQKEGDGDGDESKRKRRPKKAS